MAWSSLIQIKQLQHISQPFPEGKNNHKKLGNGFLLTDMSMSTVTKFVVHLKKNKKWVAKTTLLPQNNLIMKGGGGSEGRLCSYT